MPLQLGVFLDQGLIFLVRLQNRIAELVEKKREEEEKKKQPPEDAAQAIWSWSLLLRAFQPPGPERSDSRISGGKKEEEKGDSFSHWEA